ncbi:hypothetical protein BABINDRAFT_164438 [Babjeviella inositovora NRRL Y-12698]|uniref:Uncharacterized protein n=1 Tax=Babjeviella inositovora NRRL Y-12698 TaxID=984486 RepID=A0A1E3QYI8_9ASCO|nr:uncharacterized protein BABINDRAFT_164438 [Babjeviella inositovora NRRL Y-12698]ODQ82686.1 hypothetical protein BABINDRAFT_164438 [Babjeviella inositovora NRRL Y-12698]
MTSTMNGTATTPLPFPENALQVQLYLLRYSNLYESGTSASEKKALETVLHDVSEAQAAYLLQKSKLEEAKAKQATPEVDLDLLLKQLLALNMLSGDLDLPETLQRDLGGSYTAQDGPEPAQDVVLPIAIAENFADRAEQAGITHLIKKADPVHDVVGNFYSEQSVSAKISQRLAQLELMPSTIGGYDASATALQAPDALVSGVDALKVKSLIELKSLRVLSKQKQLRQDLIFKVSARAHNDIDYLKNSPITQSAQRSLHIRPKVITPQTARLAEQLEEQQRQEKQAYEHSLHMARVHNIVVQADAFVMAKSTRETRRYAMSKSVSQIHAQIERDELRRMEKTAKQRLQALKANDEEAYIKLLDQTKDTRITHLLKQTNSFLDSLSQAVKMQQAEAIVHQGGEVQEEAAASAVDDSANADLREKIDYYEVAHKIKEEVTEQPRMLVGGTLKEYQIKGLQWMVSLYNNHLNGILADEMGLGKTIQSISLITYLIEKKRETNKFLVIVPLSTITNWTLEFEKWAPSVRTIVYKGSPPQRKLMSYDIRSGNFQVLLTTYEYIIKDRPMLAKFHWAHMIIDEGHRMKNANSKLSQTLTQYYHTKHRLILTGTPLQNNLPELWALLNFVLPKVFNSVKSFDEWFNTPFANTGGQDKIELTEEETLLVIRRLHKVLRPFLLRRLKKEVEKDLPDKVERVLKCKLSGLQSQMYQQMLKYNALFVGAGVQGATKSGIRGLNNKIMQLRKVCNHPYLFEEVEDIINPSHMTNDDIWRVSGKFELLDRVLPKFKASGHRVLIFFQMTHVMDIMEDFMRSKAMTYLRLDGSTKADERTDMLKEFNAPDSEVFAFLLSTRAGGLGLNLQTADTVIIFDSDWNPHQDLQAQDRAHRIGQKNEVRILRLITDDSIEEVILARAHQKLDIDGKVIQAGKFDNKSTAEEQEAFLKRLLESEQAKQGNDEDNEVDDDELNEILARGDEERELFAQIDSDRIATAMVEAREAGVALPLRLMAVEELPSVFTEDIGIHMQPAKEELGRTREKKRVFYDDGLTEEQWLEAVDNDEDSIEDAIERKRARAENRQIMPDSEEDDDVFADELPVESVVTKRPSPAAESGPVKKKGRGRPPKVAVNLPQWATNALGLLEEILQVREEGRSLTDVFLDIPSKKQYPDYFLVIAQPVSINSIKKTLKQGKYASIGEFAAQLKLMFANARTYNEEGSWVYNDTLTLEAFVDERLPRLA